MTKDGTPKYYTPPQLAKLANVHRSTVTKDVRVGRIPDATRVGPIYVVPAAAGLQYVQKLRAAPPKQGQPRT